VDILNIGQPAQSDLESLYFSHAEFELTPGLKKWMIVRDSMDENDWETDGGLKLFMAKGPSQITCSESVKKN
jgi:hypothetical protein